MTEGQHTGTEGLQLWREEAPQVVSSVRYPRLSGYLGSASGSPSYDTQPQINWAFSIYYRFSGNVSERFGRTWTAVGMERSGLRDVTKSYRALLDSILSIGLRPSESRSAVSDIFILKCFYVLREEKAVTEFLEKEPSLIQLLSQAYDQIVNHFPGSNEVILEVVSDPEAIGEEELVAFIRTQVSPDEALERLGSFEEEWWLDNCHRAQAKLCFHVEFA